MDEIYKPKVIIECKKDRLYPPGFGYRVLLECGHTLWMAHEPILAGKVTCSACIDLSSRLENNPN